MAYDDARADQQARRTELAGPVEELRDGIQGRVARRKTLGLIVGALALAVGVVVILIATEFGSRIGYDFRAYLSAAGDVVAGHNPYHELIQQAPDTRSGAAGLHTNGYVYPPLLALAFSIPIRLGLSPAVIWLGWIAITAGAVGWAGWEMARYLCARVVWQAAAGFSASILVAAVSIYDLSLGQVDLLLVGLTVGAIGLWLRRHPLAGAVLGVSIAIKPILIGILAIWLWKRDWRAVLAGALAALAFTFGPFVFVGLQALHDYAVFMLHWSALLDNADFINQSIYGMLLRMLTPNPYISPLVDAPWLVTPLRFVLCLGVVMLWVRAVPRTRGTDAATTFMECLLGIVVILLVSPLAEDIHYCLLLPALVGSAWLAWSRGRPWRWSMWLCLGALGLCWTPRMQELVYPDKLVQLPLQYDPHIGPLVGLLRSGILLFVALATLVGGIAVLHLPRRSENTEERVLVGVTSSLSATM
jgi:hypothetical protein